MNEIPNIEKAISRMLTTEKANIISISGNWGVGKSYFWFNYIKKEVKKNAISNKKYSYVSLFGINNLDQLKSTIFEHSVSIEKAGEATTFKSFAENLKTPISELSSGWKSPLSHFLSNTPQIKDYSSLVFKALYLTVHNTLICIDDLERKGDGLRIDDVLGLASELKEQRNCQIVFILNKDQLVDIENYKKYHEKVIDYEYSFERTPENIFEIGFPKEAALYDFYLEKINKLQLKNIRVIKKLAYYDSILEKLCKKFHNNVYKQAAGSLPLLVAIHFASNDHQIPNLDFIKNKYEWILFEEDKNTEQEKKWNLFLHDYRWTHYDDIDEALNEMIIKGYANEPLLLEKFGHLHEMFEKGVRRQEIQDIWTQYRSKLIDDESIFIEKMITTYQQHLEIADTNDINNIIWLLRELGKNSDANMIIDQYLIARKDFIQSPKFDDDNYPGNKKLDERLDDGIKKLISSIRDKRDLHSVIDKFSKLDGYGIKDEEFLNKITEDEFYDFFSNVNSNLLPGYVQKILEFSNLSKESTLKEPGVKAKTALQKMFGKSNLTDIKLKQMGLAPKESID